MSSSPTEILCIENGIWIKKVSEGLPSAAFANSKYFDRPSDTEDLHNEDHEENEDENFLFFAGGENFEFEPLEIEIWGLYSPPTTDC